MVQPGHPGPPAVDNNMTMSIVALLLFWPLAIPAIMSASKVNPLLQQGDFAGAQAAAADSKKWSKLSLIIGLSLWGLGILSCCGFFVLAGASAGLNS